MDRPIVDDLQEDAAEILSVINSCKSLHVLPRAGGLLDQDSLFVYVLTVVEGAYAERQKLDNQQASRRRK